MTREEFLNNLPDALILHGEEVRKFVEHVLKWADEHRYISIEETNQLPPKIEGEEITEYYFVAGLNGLWYDVLRYDYRDGRWSDHHGNYYTCVTHWMPLVKPL